MNKFNIITENSEYMKPLLLIQKESSEILTNSSLMIIKGESGSGKSRLALNLIVGFTGHDDELGFSYDICPKDKYIVYLSTEMSKYHLQKRLINVLNVVDESYKSNIIFVDSFEELDKLKYLESLCKEYPPHVVIIDQLADFVPSVNDEPLAKAVVRKISGVANTYDCGVIGIIHQNEDSNISAKARGHLGSELEQKIIAALAIADNSKGFRIKSTKLREGKHFTIDTIFNEETSMLKKVEIIVDDELVDLLKFPSNKKAICDQIGVIRKVTAYKTQEKILDDLIKKNILIETKVGKFSTITKKE